MKIAVIHDYADMFRKTAAFPRLSAHDVTVYNDAYIDPDRVVDQAYGCEALVLTQQRVPITHAVVERLPTLRFISQTGKNVYHLDVDACTERGVVVSATGGADGGSPYSATAELAWGLIIASLRHLPYEIARFKAGHWQSTAGTRLTGATLGVYAYGHIGSAVARVGDAFGMNVVCWGREQSLARARFDGFDVASSREEFFESADIVTLHLPGNVHTRGIVKREDLARMKSSAVLVNTSRASIIEEGALVEALHAGRPGRAAVDVFEQEPVLGAAHPLLALDNALCTPHLGYTDQRGYETMYGHAVEQLLAYAAGAPINVINPDALGAP